MPPSFGSSAFLSFSSLPLSFSFSFSLSVSLPLAGSEASLTVTSSLSGGNGFLTFLRSANRTRGIFVMALVKRVFEGFTQRHHEDAARPIGGKVEFDPGDLRLEFVAGHEVQIVAAGMPGRRILIVRPTGHLAQLALFHGPDIQR